jgi:hypothetical protein
MYVCIYVSGLLSTTHGISGVGAGHARDEFKVHQCSGECLDPNN